MTSLMCSGPPTNLAANTSLHWMTFERSIRRLSWFASSAIPGPMKRTENLRLLVPPWEANAQDYTLRGRTSTSPGDTDAG